MIQFPAMTQHPPTRRPTQFDDGLDGVRPRREPPRVPGRLVLLALAVLGLLVAINLYFLHGGVQRRVDYAFLRARTALKKLRPHERYLPTPDLGAISARETGTSEAAQALEPTATGQPIAATPTPTTRAALTPTAAPTPTLTVAPTATPETAPLPARVLLENDCHEPQGWNNCGPATLAMALRFYGWTEDQYVVAAATKPDGDDKNVSPDEMVIYALAQPDTYAVMGYATDLELLKRLLAAGYPAIVETWFIPEPDDEMGHYRLLTGYDDAEQVFVTQDAYQGADQRVSYDEFEHLWKVFDRVYLEVCPANRAHALSVLLGHHTAPERMYGDALALALAEIEADPEDRYAWFNAGTNYLGLGQFERAAAAYDQARLLQLPWRMLWYQFGPFETYLRVGRYQDVIVLADANLDSAENLEESYYYRALARRALGDEDGARADLEAALRYNPLYERALEALDD
jgi:hypothetical protein